ncbi:MAG: hypothetical protein HWN81_14945 [Candidatus Lokiarchaeota archaeon]|nr:hypothetical protein [Candidatus Lokiarchaeota archaeon]
MKISGKVKINKKYQSEDFDFQRNDVVGWGKLSWSNKIKDNFTYTNKFFSVFNDAADIIADNLGKMFFIKGVLRTEEYRNSEGELKKIEKIIIESAVVYENVQKEEDSINQVKRQIQESTQNTNIYDDIPF